MFIPVLTLFSDKNYVIKLVFVIALLSGNLSKIPGLLGFCHFYEYCLLCSMQLNVTYRFQETEANNIGVEIRNECSKPNNSNNIYV